MNEFVLLNTAKVSLDSRWNYKNIISPFYRLYFIDDGRAEVTLNGEVQALKAGHMYLIPSFTLSNYFCDSYMIQYYVHIEEVLRSEASLKQRSSLLFEVKASEVDQVLFQRLVDLNPNRALVNHEPEYTLLSQLDVNLRRTETGRYLETSGIILQLISRFIDSDNPKGEPDLKGLSRLSAVLLHIHENYDSGLTVKGLASIANQNEDYFSRVFLRYVGLRPLPYINQLRIERAQHLLLFSDLSINEIAYKVGFENRTYFAKQFKRYSGKSAGEYRRESDKV